MVLIKVIMLVIFVWFTGILSCFCIMFSVVIERMYGMMLVMIVKFINVLNCLLSEGLMVIKFSMF